MEADGDYRGLRLVEPPEPEYRVVSISNVVIAPDGRIFPRPRSRVRCAWLALRGFRLYYD